MAKARLRLRSLWFQVHLWLGVALCLLVVPVCVTGAYEVWQDQIDDAFHPHRFAVTSGAPLGPDAYASAAQAAFGDRARVTVVRLPLEAGDVALVTGQQGRPEGDRARSEGAAQRPPAAAPARRPTLTAWVDPASAKVLDVADPAKSFKQTMHRLHGSLLITGGNGRKIVGWLGWALLASALTGIWLWWPGRGFLKGFRYRRTGSTLLNLHYLTGFWIAIPLAVLAFSGAVISFPQMTRAALGSFTQVTPQQRPGGAGGPAGGGGPVLDPALTPTRVAELAQAAAPGQRVQTINMPTRSREGGPNWRVQLAAPEGRAGQIVTVADETGAAELQKVRPTLAGDDMIRVNRRIHDGEGTGIVWKVIITLAGLIPALLAVTGVIVWATRQMRKAALRRPDSGDRPAPQPAAGE